MSSDTQYKGASQLTDDTQCYNASLQSTTPQHKARAKE